MQGLENSRAKKMSNFTNLKDPYLYHIVSILEDFEKKITIFSQTVNAIEKLLAAFNVQLKICMIQSLI